MDQIDAKFFVIPSSHLDFYWLGTREEMFSRGNKIISMAIDLAERDIEFRFFLECMGFVHDFLRNHPEKREELGKLARNGRIELIAQWAGIPQSDCSGEELVRNIIYAKQFIQEEFGINPLTTSIIDIGSATLQFPQIISKAGIRYLITGRARPHGLPLYYWKATDGSKVLTWSPEESAPNAVTLGLNANLNVMRERKLDEKIKEAYSKYSCPIAAIYTVDLLLPPRKLCQNIREWNKQSHLKISVATPTEYFKRVEDRKDIPEISGEMPQVYRGAGAFESVPARSFTIDTKIRNLLLTAEKFSTISHILGYMPDSSSKIKEAWIHFINAHSHGSDATGGEESDRRKIEDRRIAELCAEELIRDSLRTIAENIKSPKGNCIPIVVFNPLSWERTDIVTAHATIYGDDSPFRMTEFMCRIQGRKYEPIREEYVLKDSEGNIVPLQIIEIKEVTAREIKFVFVAEKVPPLGYKTYYLLPVEKAEKHKGTCKVNETTIENNFFRVKIDRKTGNLNIFDKQLEKDIIKNLGIIQMKERFKGEKLPRLFLGRRKYANVKKIEVKENGPVRTKIIIYGEKDNVKTMQEIILYEKLRRIDLKVSVDWKRKEKLQPLRFSVASRILLDIPIQLTDKPNIVYGVPYGFNNLENVAPRSGPSPKDIWQTDRETWKKYREIQQWIDVSEKDFGVTIATNLVGMRVNPPIAVCLVRWPESCTANFSIRSHKFGWKEAKAYRQGSELNNPLVSVTVNDTYTEKRLQPEMSFCHTDADNIIITVLKKSEEKNGVVLRFYEAEGKPTETNISFIKEIRSAVETDLLEKEKKALDGMSIQVNAQEIKTVKLRTY